MLNNAEFKRKCYKNKYLISFYDERDENHIACFDNLRQICQFRGKEVTSQNLTLMGVELYRAIKREDHSTRMLDGTLMHVYLIDIDDID